MLFHRSSIVLKSRAKINLSLKIVGINDKNYHLLDMVNLPLELHDVISVAILPNAPDTFITTDDAMLNSLKKNLCGMAVKAMRDEFGFHQNFNIRIHKEIPFAAGLGGGSSNAATVMLAINELLRLKAPLETLNKIALTIGSDAPYFLINKPARLGGIGEIIDPISVKKEYFCLIAKPKKGVCTTEAYSLYKPENAEKSDNDKVIQGLLAGDDQMIADNIGNDLKEAAISLVPEIKTLLESLKSYGFPIVSMSGSGSSCFALTDNIKLAKEAARKLEAQNYLAIITKTVR